MKKAKKKPIKKAKRKRIKTKPMGGVGVPETNVDANGTIQPEDTPDATV